MSAWKKNGRYFNLDGLKVPATGRLRRLIRWRFGPRAAPVLEGGTDTPPAPVKVNERQLDFPAAMQVTWLGHATTLIQLDGLNVLTDPVFGHCGFGTVRRLAPAPISVDALPPIHVVLVSHNHYDHCDLPSLKHVRRCWPEAVIVCADGLAGWLKRRVGGPVVEVAWWAHHVVGALKVHAVPAQHWSVRGAGDGNRSHWCGFIVEGPSGRIYFAGDTGFGPHFAAIRRLFPKMDAAILPIGAYAPRWFMEGQHMGPEDAVRAAEMMGGVMLPMHWGTFKLTDEPIDEPPRVAAIEAKTRGVPLALLMPGGTWLRG